MCGGGHRSSTGGGGEVGLQLEQLWSCGKRRSNGGVMRLAMMMMVMRMTRVMMVMDLG